MLSIPSRILGFTGQKVNELFVDEQEKTVKINCTRDNRFNALSPVTKGSGKIISLTTREVKGIPFLGYQMKDPWVRYTNRGVFWKKGWSENCTSELNPRKNYLLVRLCY